MQDSSKAVWPSLLVILLIGLSACQPDVVRLLPRDEGQWEIRSFVFEYVRAEDLIERLDTTDYGVWVFEEEGVGYWLQDSLVVDTLNWSSPADNQISLRFEGNAFRGRRTFVFRLLENRRREQLWRSETTETVFDPLRQDSVAARHLMQVSLMPVE